LSVIQQKPLTCYLISYTSLLGSGGNIIMLILSTLQFAQLQYQITNCTNAKQS